MNPEVVQNILKKHSENRDGLISILEDIQTRFGYLPADALKIVADETGKSLVDIYGVATFYKSFSLKPRGKHLISVCLGTACHVRGAAHPVSLKNSKSSCALTQVKRRGIANSRWKPSIAWAPVLWVRSSWWTGITSRR